VRSLLWLTSSATKRTAGGEKDTRPALKATTTVVGRALRSVTVRRPTVRLVTWQPSSVRSVTVFHCFVTLPWRVTLNAIRLG
jgi:hypothetical protein